MNATSDRREPAETVAPEEEKRETLGNEPSAAQAVKNAAQDKLRSADDASGPDGELMGLDAPGFGDRGPEELRRMASSAGADTAAREAATVDAEFDGMDNDLIDMGDFGENGTGSGTQAGGAGERLRPTSSADAPAARAVPDDAAKDD